MAIVKPTDYFNTVLYSGTGNEQTVSGVNFQPDFTWLKSRTNGQPHTLQNSVTGATKQMHTNSNATETSYTQLLKSFNSDGFVLGTDSFINQNGQTFVSWNWKTGTSFSNSANTNGATLATAGSFNNDAGVSIFTYTGNASNATLKHGLNSKVQVVIIKNRSDTGAWGIGHASIGYTRLMAFNTGAGDTDATYWQNTAPTDNIVTIGGAGEVNKNTSDMLAICFSQKTGFSQYGSYTGNGAASNGPFIYTDFTPGFVMIKRTDASGHNWQMHDNKRSSTGGNNLVNSRLLPNLTNAEDTDTIGYDFLSNGFKLRTNNASYNASGGTYIYFCFAANSFVTSTDDGSIPATAR